MNTRLLMLFAASFGLFAADEQHLALALKAQTDFERVTLSPSPQLPDTNTCIQTEAAMLTIATPEELPLIHFRKGYCTMAAAAMTREAAAFERAAAEFDKATETWAARNLFFAKKRPAEPNPSIFPVLASIARFENGKGDVNQISAAEAVHACPVSVVAADRCEAVLRTGREWLGWAALGRGEIDAAAREFPATSTAWTNWVAGVKAFRDRKYPDAVAAYRRAVEAWEAQAKLTAPTVLQRLSPPADLSAGYTELGGAQLLAGDAAGAIGTLDQAVRQSPSNAKALYLRARAKDTAGQFTGAIADYNLAARNALAKAEDQAGEAHLYRGISLYRRKEFQHAEDEFTNALNFNISESSRADAVAWRRLAAVASGSCEAARRDLEEALPAASPYFPREDARKELSACSAISKAAISGTVK